MTKPEERCAYCEEHGYDNLKGTYLVFYDSYSDTDRIEPCSCGFHYNPKRSGSKSEMPLHKPSSHHHIYKYVQGLYFCRCGKPLYPPLYPKGRKAVEGNESG